MSVKSRSLNIIVTIDNKKTLRILLEIRNISTTNTASEPESHRQQEFAVINTVRVAILETYTYRNARNSDN